MSLERSPAVDLCLGLQIRQYSAVSAAYVVRHACSKFSENLRQKQKLNGLASSIIFRCHLNLYTYKKEKKKKEIEGKKIVIQQTFKLFCLCTSP